MDFLLKSPDSYFADCRFWHFRLTYPLKPCIIHDSVSKAIKLHTLTQKNWRIRNPNVSSSAISHRRDAKCYIRFNSPTRRCRLLWNSFGRAMSHLQNSVHSLWNSLKAPLRISKSSMNCFKTPRKIGNSIGCLS